MIILIDKILCLEELLVKAVSFLKNVSREMKKVSWPGKQELYRYTVIVVVTVVLIALFFTVVDFGISQILNLFFD